MGNTISAPPPAVASVGQIQPVVTVPLQRTPVQDGASGLQYSGRVYTNQFAQLSTDICKGASASIDQINDVYPGNGISSSTLAVDETTKRIQPAALNEYVESLVSTGKIPGLYPSFDQQAQADKQFYALVQQEYCFYEPRYRTALNALIQMLANQQGSDSAATNTLLQTTVALNMRLNSLLEIISHVGNQRARNVNKRAPEIDNANKALNAQISQLSAQQNMLTSGRGRLETQEEMLRYSAEKSRAMNIQIAFFVALNVVALGTVITVYKKLGQ